MAINLMNDDNRDHYNAFARGPKSLNFPDGNFQRAKTFRTKCIIVFATKKTRKSFLRQKSVRKFFCDKKVCVNRFCIKTSVLKSFLQQKKCALIVFATKKCTQIIFATKKVHRIAIRCSNKNNRCCFCYVITILW